MVAAAADGDDYARSVFLLLAVLAVASAPMRPPAIHERFTPLPCPKHRVSTLDIEGCLEQAILAADTKIDSQARAIFGLLHGRAARLDFVRGESSWLAYRRASCSAEASKYAGGTEVGVLDASCTADRSRTHLAELVAMRRTLGRP
jgi:uncharacterized protein YecT (DUF1311 family)